MNVITRFPPSPTGNLHIGNARTALFNYLFAHHEKGKMFFRFEDTDKARSKKEYEDDIYASLAWLGIEYANSEIPRQSERTEVYKKYFDSLLANGLAYEAEPSTEHPEKKVVRFKNPGSRIVFNDLIRGEVSFDTAELGDFVIARNVDEPLYHLAVVIDDYEMGVTHVIRGEDHISNTPRQILILEALGFPRPVYAHLPLILAKDRSKFSKRNGSATVREYIDQGYLPEAFLNYLALLGWHPGTDEEIFTKTELIERFNFDQVQKSGAIFDETKLKWVNREHIMRMSPEAFRSYAEQFLSPGTIAALKEKNLFDALIPVMRERIQTFGELAELDREGEFAYFHIEPSYEVQKLCWKEESPEATKGRLMQAQTLLEGISEALWASETVKSALWPYAEQEGRGNVLWPLRYALSGREKSPDPFTIAGIIGRDETTTRIKRAVSKLATG